MILAIAILCGVVGLLVGAVALIRRSDRRLGPGPGTPSTPSTPATGGAPDPIAAYLDRMSGELALPAADVAEVRAELADHLQDSIASLEAEGFDRETAIREALGRLGPAAELGRQIRAAHQSTRRLLAGAGGGIFAASGAFVLGYIAGGFMVAGLAVGLAAITAALAAVGLHLPDLIQDPHGIGGNSILIVLATAIAALAATRYAVRTSASLSHRTPQAFAVFWAVAGGLGFGWWALFGLHGYQSWPTVAAELCIPVAAVAGALLRTERPFVRAPRLAIVVGLIAVIVLPLILFAATGVSSVSVSTTGEATSFQMSDLHLDTVAPMAPTKWLPEAEVISGDYTVDYASGATVVSADRLAGPSSSTPDTTLPIQPLLSNWRDIRFEAWHAISIDLPGPGGIDTHYTSPFAVQPATLHGDSLSASFSFQKYRNAGSWWIVLTAVGPDGHRYRLDIGGGDSTSFNGSAWDWLTAPQ
ncbi:MAG: permease prefix domain 1-containing protein [Candidatus Limnocylindrales bacterium]